ncbi:F0F1 ATP synthase subunit gamma [Aquabacterium sp.]|uniref:F0F1 ATP synthase subunit gamma n=1 Tax=Aquabacterium sp. TaxID=1872578 RepID=UPI0019AD392A|nr:F0F1 ATP synthase subunit gamma [Aquabacterium sp.]MBC7700522.1 F0F1 ATP synthase subunit gamma [Aquabacterium sp.]
MSNTTASLRRQIDSAADLQAVVRTMKALAASSIGQYEQSVQALADYDRTVELALGACLRRMGPMPSGAPKLKPAAATMVSAVVFGSDQGLVGRFNEAVADHAVASLAALAKPGSAPKSHSAPRVWAVGERVHSRLTDAGVQPVGRFAVPTSIGGIVPLIGQILTESQRHGGHGMNAELHLFYNSPATGSTFASVGQKLLPLDEDWRRSRAEIKWPAQHLPEVIGGAATLGPLIGEYLFVSLFRACAESLASENASRLAAMQRADKNIDEVLATLRGDFHRLRQSRIDEELFDVISGFEALNRQ